MGFLFLLVSELAFGDACFLMSGREVLTPFLLIIPDSEDLPVVNWEYDYAID